MDTRTHDDTTRGPHAGAALLALACLASAGYGAWCALFYDGVSPVLVPFALAAIAAWILSWARSWVLAWVSERIAADLRVRTYAHMQNLSLDFFSGKRTGDLITRVGNDTDRLNLFLSVNLIEFTSNVMLVLLTPRRLVELVDALRVWLVECTRRWVGDEDRWVK